jgi:hypothetical protein
VIDRQEQRVTLIAPSFDAEFATHAGGYGNGSSLIGGSGVLHVQLGRRDGLAYCDVTE